MNYNAHVILYKELLYLIAAQSGNWASKILYFSEWQREMNPSWSPFTKEELEFEDAE